MQQTISNKNPLANPKVEDSNMYSRLKQVTHAASSKHIKILNTFPSSK